ncbi:MAG: ABC transporter substrate-binding protein [Anaerolineae bacterium]|nr:ABC transporter substrate-binding protein [Anaerolineae bacterium]MDQ7036748.1 ABC transporter substrate-binding protein [Anaerolineae bacterium]
MRKLLVFITLLLFIIVLAPVAAQDDMMDFPGEHTPCEVDLTGETITFYHFGDLSGPLAAITGPIVLGYDDATAYFTEQGTLCGATIEYANEDTGGDRERTQAAYDRFTSEFDVVALGLYASDDAELLREQLAEDEIPVIISAGSTPGLYGEDGQSPGWVYATNPLYVDQMGDFCEYVSENPDTFPDPVMGYLGWPNAFGQAAFTPEATAYCESLGVDFIDTPELFSPAEPDIIVNVQNLVDAGANILYVNALGPNGPGKVAQAMADLGIEGEVALAGVNWVMDISTGLTSQGAVRADSGLPVISGMYGSAPFAWWTETDNPSIQFLTQMADANEHGLGIRGVTYLLTWGNIDLLIEAYIQTVNRVGSLDGVTGAELKATLDTIDYQPLGGLYTANFEDGAIRDVGLNRIAVMQFLNATGDGVATSADDAFVVEGASIMIPIIVPVTDFNEVPDLRPGMDD